MNGGQEWKPEGKLEKLLYNKNINSDTGWTEFSCKVIVVKIKLIRFKMYFEGFADKSY